MKRGLRLYDSDTSSDDDSDSEEDDLDRQARKSTLCLAIAGTALMKIIENLKQSRRMNPYLKRRQDWDFLVNNLLFEGQFKHSFRMSMQSFENSD